MNLTGALFDFFGIKECQGAKRSGILIDDVFNFPAPCDCYDDAFFWGGIGGKAAWKVLPKSTKIKILSNLGLINFIKNRAASVYNATRITKLQEKSKEILNKIKIKEKVIDSLEKLYDKKLKSLNDAIKDLTNNLNIKKNNYKILKDSMDSMIERAKKLNDEIFKKNELFMAQKNKLDEIQYAANENSRRLRACLTNVPRADQQLICGGLKMTVEEQTKQFWSLRNNVINLKEESQRLLKQRENLRGDLYVKKTEIEGSVRSINAEEERIWRLENEELPSVREERIQRINREQSGIGDPDLSELDEPLDFFNQRKDAIQDRLDEVNKNAGWGDQVDEEFPDIGKIIGQAGIDFLLFFSFITPRNCRDKWDSVSNDKYKGAEIDEQTCKCTKCPEKMTLCEPWKQIVLNAGAIFRIIGEPWPPGGFRTDDEYNRCMNCCPGEDMVAKDDLSGLDCVCECGTSLSGKKLTKKMGSGCSCDDGENKEDKYKCAPPPPDADTTWISSYEWDESKCKWCSTDTTEDCPEDCPCGGNNIVEQTHNHTTASTSGSCSSPLTYGMKTISVPAGMELPITVSIQGGVDDVLLVDGSPIQEGCARAGFFCHTFTLTNSSFTIAARDNFGGNAGYNVKIIFCPKR